MKNSKKGFTLIELLAIIVILAVIALITTPIILNVVENSRKNAAVDKAYGVIEAVRLAYTQNQVTTDPVTGKDTICVTYGSETTETGCTVVYKKTVGSTDVSVSGDTPSSGMVMLNTQDGTLTIKKQLVFGDYKCNMGADTKVACTK